MNHKATALGIMSGSSLDGLDICKVVFSHIEEKWSFEILETETLNLPDEMISRLRKSTSLNEKELAQLDGQYGQLIGDISKGFCSGVEVIGLHGHTVRHSPKDKISEQIGSAEVVAETTKLPTVGNFRMKDILLGGQGAPLVPMGEKHLFPEFESFLNLGGICNSSHHLGDDNWIAGDIAPFNQVFNFYAKKLGKPFDENGDLANSGKIRSELINRWNRIPFFEKPFPKSLGNDWVEDHFFHHTEPPEDVLATFSEFIAEKIATQLNSLPSSKTLVTGGGAWNGFLIEKLKQKCRGEIEIPTRQIVEFKEALIFAFLGLLRKLNLPNVLSSCTGAKEDSCGGDLYTP